MRRIRNATNQNAANQNAAIQHAANQKCVQLNLTLMAEDPDVGSGLDFKQPLV